jgi:hypothetical protein
LVVLFFGYIIWHLDYPSSEEIEEYTGGFHQVKVKEHWSKHTDSNGRHDWMIDYYDNAIDYLLKRNLHTVKGEQ